MSVSKLESEFVKGIGNLYNYMYTIVKNKCPSASGNDIQDIVSNATINLWDKRQVFLADKEEIQPRDLKAWVSRFTHNHVVWYFSNKQRKDKNIDFDSEKFDVISEVIGEEDSQLNAFFSEDSKENMYHRYLSVLNKEERSVFKLMWAGFSNKQIADIYDITREGMRLKMESIRIKLNKHFNSESADEQINNSMTDSRKLELLKSIIE
tara:strand:+ start:34296 stop:34919 length:624 start_codon:yes stop_codon:yes gene_type:complete